VSPHLDLQLSGRLLGIEVQRPAAGPPKMPSSIMPSAAIAPLSLSLSLSLLLLAVPPVGAEPPLGSRARHAHAHDAAHRVLQTGAAELCDIGGMFAGLSQIKLDADCQAGCAGGSGVCPADWLPSAADECSAACGRVFEPFWDRCGTMLTNAGMGGMDEMGAFCESSPEPRVPLSERLSNAHPPRALQMTAVSRASILREAAVPTAVRTPTIATARR
jgi:hypothetical protein